MTCGSHELCCNVMESSPLTCHCSGPSICASVEVIIIEAELSNSLAVTVFCGWEADLQQ